MGVLRLSLLGPFGATLDGRPISSFRTRATQALLIYLACNPGQTQSRDHLMALLWPGLPEYSARLNLRQTIYRLRRLIPESPAINGYELVPFLLADREAVQINHAARIEVDILTFETLLHQGGRALQPAMELYRGEFLADFFLHDSRSFEEWTLARREELRGRALKALDTLAEEALQSGEPAAAEAHARQALAIDSLRESAHRYLMAALAQSGRRRAAVTHFKNLSQLLNHELGIGPSAATQTVYEAICTGRMDPIETPGLMPPVISDAGGPPAGRSNLPPRLAPFFGRAAELRALASFASDPDTRLITIVGPGGVGKSCLALEAARLQVENFMHGVWYTSLAPISSPEEIIPAVAQTLNIQFFPGETPRKQLLHYLKGRTLFLLLDNYEHLLDEASLVSEILAHAPSVKILVTSREPLRLVEEQLLHLEGLAYSRGGVGEDDPAVQLFLERARRLRPDLAIRPADLPHLTAICHQVDGMPLGLVLAATWADTLSLADIAGELQGSLDLLATDLRNMLGRHLSMEAVFDVSWGRLKPEEQRLFTELTVFRGGFSRDAAWKTCSLDAGDRALRDLLSALGRKSFVKCDPASGRYEIHELMRQYGAKKLSEDQEHELQVRDSHAAYFCEYLGELYEQLKGPRQKQAATEIDVDYDNGRSAWLWAIKRRMWPDLQQIVLLWDYFLDTWRSRHQEGDNMYARLVDGLTGHDQLLPLQLLILALICRARFHCYLGQFEEAALLRARAQGLFLQPPIIDIDQWPGKAYALCELGHHAAKRSDWYQQCLGYVRGTGDRWDEAFTLLWLGNEATFQLREDDGQAYYEKGLAIGRQLGNQILCADLMVCLSNLAHQQYRFEDAEALAKEALELYKDLENKRRIADAQDILGHIYLYSGRYAHALKAYGDRLQLFEELAIISHIAVSHYWLSHTYLHSGEYALSRAEAESFLSMAAGAQYEHALGLTMMGNNALVEGDLAAAARYFCESENIMQATAAPVVRTWYAGFHVVTLVHRGDLDKARQVIGKALDCEAIAPTCIILFAGIALLHWAEKRWLRAVELYAMACMNPYAGQSRWVADVVGTHIHEAEARLPEDAVSAAHRRGQALSINDAAAATRAELFG